MESHFTPLLSTNYVPSKDELDEIRHLLVEPEDQLNQLHMEIAHLHNLIDKLSSKRDQLHTSIVHHKVLMTPLRRIPKELLQEIFFHCLPVDHNATMSCHDAPLLLGRVCSYWRSVSLGTPRLWSGIHIVAPVITEPFPSQNPGGILEPNHAIFEAVEAWLGRSGDLPLSISLYQVPYGYTLPESTEKLISTIIQFSRRWRKVTLIGSSPTNSQLFSLSPTVLPLLESFSFYPTYHPSSFVEMVFESLDIFRAPRLRILSSSHFGAVPPNMDWSRLTSLSLESQGYGQRILSPSEAIGILRKSPNLIHCELNFLGGFGYSPSLFNDHDFVTMPCLKSFSIQEGMLSLKSFYKQLRLPALVDLEFAASSSMQDFDIDGPRQPICSLLSRIDSLKGLTVRSMDFTPTAIMSCLQLSPSITRLSVLSTQTAGSWELAGDPWAPFNDEVAAFLTPAKGQPPVCPLLKVFECSPCSASDASLLALIEQRTIHASTHNIQPLERVDVDIIHQNDLDIQSMLPPNILAETTISLRYLTPPAVYTTNTPKAGLEKPGRLQIPTNIYRYLSR